MEICKQKRKIWFVMARAVLAVGVITTVFGAAGCVVEPFTKASGTFATAAKAGVDAIAPAFATASSLCRTRARMDFMFVREQGLSTELWSKWYETHRIENDRIDPSRRYTWKDHCDILAKSDAMLARGLDAVGAYAAALKAAAESSGYDGKTLDNLVKDSAGLAQALSGNSTSTKSTTDTVAGLSGPIASIGKFAVQAYAVGKLKDAVRSGGPEVDKILDALKKYNAAVEPSIKDAEHRLANLLDQADASIRTDDETAKRPKPDAMRLFAFHDTAIRYEKNLADLRSEWTAYGSAMDALSKANKAMSDAAEGKMKDEDALKLVLGFANEVVTQLATVKKVAAGGKE